jgi:hypothetical protein
MKMDATTRTFSEIWNDLIAPVPAAEIEYRPGFALDSHRASCAGKSCRETHNPNSHKQLAYFDARWGMNRLDRFLTGVPACGWSYAVAPVAASNDAIGTLEVTINGVKIVRSDFGVPNNAGSSEARKEASTDAFRRCLTLVGVGRGVADSDDDAPVQFIGAAPEQINALRALAARISVAPATLDGMAGGSVDTASASTIANLLIRAEAKAAALPAAETKPVLVALTPEQMDEMASHLFDTSTPVALSPERIAEIDDEIDGMVAF